MSADIIVLKNKGKTAPKVDMGGPAFLARCGDLGFDLLLRDAIQAPRFGVGLNVIKHGAEPRGPIRPHHEGIGGQSRSGPDRQGQQNSVVRQSRPRRSGARSDRR